MTYQNGRTAEVKETKANANIIYIYIIILNQLIGKLKGWMNKSDTVTGIEDQREKEKERDYCFALHLQIHESYIIYIPLNSIDCFPICSCCDVSVFTKLDWGKKKKGKFPN